MLQAVFLLIVIIGREGAVWEIRGMDNFRLFSFQVVSPEEILSSQ
jgi:hypothetical protein